jgi:hypothetical protein
MLILILNKTQYNLFKIKHELSEKGRKSIL